MRFLGALLVVGGVLTLCVLGLSRVWRSWCEWDAYGREPAPRQPGLAAPPAPPIGLDENRGIEGVYVATTTAYDWQDRIAAHGLDVRSRASVVVAADGVAILRSAAPSLFIPAEDLLSVRTAHGGNGPASKSTAPGLVVFTWQHDGHRLDTGFRPRHAADVPRLTEQAGDLTLHGFDFDDLAPNPDEDGMTDRDHEPDRDPRFSPRRPARAERRSVQEESWWDAGPGVRQDQNGAYR